MKKLLRFFVLAAMALTLVVPSQRPEAVHAEAVASQVRVGQTLTRQFIVINDLKNNDLRVPDMAAISLRNSNPDVADLEDVNVEQIDDYIYKDGTRTQQYQVTYTVTFKKEGQTLIWYLINGVSRDCYGVFNIVPENDFTPMYRLYNPNSGEHFYTSAAKEKNHLISLGWKDEGTGWYAPLARRDQAQPVYRLYNKTGGEHHYTTVIKEKNALVKAGWKNEGIGWYSSINGTAVYRQYNRNAFANNHNYTASRHERDVLISLGWKDEGIAWIGIGVSE